MQNPIGSHAHIFKSRRIVENRANNHIQLPPCQLSANNIKILSTIKTSCQRMFWAKKKSGATFITMMMVPYFGGDVGRGWST